MCISNGLLKQLRLPLFIAVLLLALHAQASIRFPGINTPLPGTSVQGQVEFYLTHMESDPTNPKLKLNFKNFFKETLAPQAELYESSLEHIFKSNFENIDELILNLHARLVNLEPEAAKKLATRIYSHLPSDLSIENQLLVEGSKSLFDLEKLKMIEKIATAYALPSGHPDHEGYEFSESLKAWNQVRPLELGPTKDPLNQAIQKLVDARIEQITEEHTGLPLSYWLFQELAKARPDFKEQYSHEFITDEFLQKALYQQVEHGDPDFEKNGAVDALDEILKNASKKDLKEYYKWIDHYASPKGLSKQKGNILKYFKDTTLAYRAQAITLLNGYATLNHATSERKFEAATSDYNDLMYRDANARKYAREYLKGSINSDPAELKTIIEYDEAFAEFAGSLDLKLAFKDAPQELGPLLDRFFNSGLDIVDSEETHHAVSLFLVEDNLLMTLGASKKVSSEMTLAGIEQHLEDFNDLLELAHPPLQLLKKRHFQFLNWIDTHVIAQKFSPLEKEAASFNDSIKKIRQLIGAFQAKVAMTIPNPCDGALTKDSKPSLQLPPGNSN